MRSCRSLWLLATLLLPASLPGCAPGLSEVAPLPVWTEADREGLANELVALPPGARYIPRAIDEWLLGRQLSRVAK